MTTKVAWLISIVFCTLNTFANAKPTVRTYVKLDNWINNCKQYKAAYVSQSGNATKLGKAGQPKQRPRIWLLNWHDLSIPIPAIAYKHFDISPTGLKLSNHGKGISIKLVRSKIDSLEYLKTTKLYESFLNPEKNGKAAWKYFFGKPMNYSQFLQQSYLHTPDELNCKPETVKSDLPILSYLIKKKTIGSNDIAYPVAGIANAFVLESSLKNSIAYSAHITSPKEKNRVVSLEIYTNKTDDFNGLGTHIGLAKNKKHSANPGWLIQLQKSLDSNKPEDWKKLSSILPGSGFDRKSAEAALLWSKVVSAKKKLNFQSKPKQANYIDPSRWLEHCIFIREKFATRKEKKIKFIDAKKPAKPVKLWKLLWNGIAIPVPAGHYDTIIVGGIDNKTSRSPSISIGRSTSLGRKKLSIAYEKKSNQIFSVKQIRRLPSEYQQLSKASSFNAEKAWNHFFNRPMSRFDIKLASMAHAPAELSCNPENIKKELPILYYLKNKIIKFNTFKIYPVKGELQGYVLEQVDTQKNEVYWNTFIQNSTKDSAYLLSLIWPKSDNYPNYGYFFSHPVNKQELKSPDWFTLLQKALDADNRGNWVKLANELKKPDFDPASANSVNKWISKKFGDKSSKQGG